MPATDHDAAQFFDGLVRAGLIVPAGVPGIFVPIEETVESFEALVNGDLDHVPEQAFLNVGGAESVLAKAHALENE